MSFPLEPTYIWDHSQFHHKFFEPRGLYEDTLTSLWGMSPALIFVFKVTIYLTKQDSAPADEKQIRFRPQSPSSGFFYWTCRYYSEPKFRKPTHYCKEWDLPFLFGVGGFGSGFCRFGKGTRYTRTWGVNKSGFGIHSMQYQTSPFTMTVILARNI